MLNQCPICKKPATEEFSPFCSLRCANIDLGKWFQEQYVIETDEDSNSDSSERESCS